VLSMEHLGHRPRCNYHAPQRKPLCRDHRGTRTYPAKWQHRISAPDKPPLCQVF
jgi:hypothetical protein